MEPSGRDRDRGRDPVSVLALALGIAAIPLIFCYVLGLPVGLAAVVLGLLGIQRARRGAGNRGLAIAGLVCGALAVIVMITIIALSD